MTSQLHIALYATGETGKYHWGFVPHTASLSGPLNLYQIKMDVEWKHTHEYGILLKQDSTFLCCVRLPALQVDDATAEGLIAAEQAQQGTSVQNARNVSLNHSH